MCANGEPCKNKQQYVWTQRRHAAFSSIFLDLFCKNGNFVLFRGMKRSNYSYQRQYIRILRLRNAIKYFSIRIVVSTFRYYQANVEGNEKSLKIANNNWIEVNEIGVMQKWPKGIIKKKNTIGWIIESYCSLNHSSIARFTTPEANTNRIYRHNNT